MMDRNPSARPAGGADPEHPEAADPRRAAIAYDRVVQLSPLVRRLTQRNPGPFTGPGTNTHLVGRTRLYILDPGEERDDGHLERVVAAVGSATVGAVVPSHGHADHWPLATRLAQALSAPIWFSRHHPHFRVDRVLHDGDRVALDGDDAEWHLLALHTPGHAADHLAFHLPAERALFPGDHVMAWSTSIIDPPDGSLPAYLASLERLLAVPDLDVLYPAHGPAVTSPYLRMRELLAHRHDRTRLVLEALAAGPASVTDLVPRVYADTDPALHAAAARSLGAHLLALEAEARVSRAPAAGGWEEAVWELTPRR